jgi:hypothetical protein
VYEDEGDTMAKVGRIGDRLNEGRMGCTILIENPDTV